MSPEHARRALLTAALLAAGVLVGLTAWSHAGLVQRTPELYRAQGEILHLTWRSLLPAGGGPPSEAAWQEVWQTLEPQGLRYLALHRPVGPPMELGEPMTGTGLLPALGEQIVRRGAVRMALPGRGPDFFVIDFEPTTANALLARSWISLIAACGAGLALVIASVVFYRQSLVAEAEARALDARRHLASLGEMSAVLAHEIKNPLAALKGHAQLLEELVAPERRERAHTVVDEAIRLERLVGSLLEFARETRLTLAPVDLGELARQVARDTDPQRVTLLLAGAPERWTADGPRLRRVLLNLVGNALEAAPAGPVELSVIAAAGRLRLQVRDHGPGFAESDPAQCFEPFHTTKTQGTGLGLAIAQRLVRLHGGTLVASNHPAGGALLVVELPRGD